jgi:histidyl-tRNA synthetase
MNTQPARGMRDFLPDDVRRRQYVIGVIAGVYQRYGFEPLETPAVENIETLLGKYGEEGDKLIFKILKRGEGEATGAADLALRYDLTVPLARVVAEHRSKLPKFFKRYQVQPVWRADRPQKGRFREFYQCDVDAIGSTSMVVEAELLAAAADVLDELGFTDYRIRLNHRKVLTGLLTAARVPAERHGEALVALDKLDKIGPDLVVAELTGRQIVDEERARALTALFHEANEDGGNEAILARLDASVGDDEGGRAGVADLREILRLAARTAAGRRLRLDPSLARGLSYYTGPIFEVAVADLAGSLGGGGRYDHLIGMFLGDEIPACGISLGLERILVVMGERGMFPPALTATPADAMLTIWSADRTADTLALAAELRAAGLRIDVYPEPDKLGKQFKYAASRGVPFVLIVGDDEAARGEVAVKNLASGEQTSMPRASVAGHITSARRA